MKFFTESKKEIYAPAHPLIKEIVLLRTDKTFRKEQNLILIMGNKMVEELSRKEPLELLIISKEIANPPPSKKTLLVTPPIMKKITSLQDPEEMAALVSRPHLSLPPTAKRLLLIDQISDPGNLGTLLRTAAALGWDGVILTPKTVDPFNDKALRAAKGATFFLPIEILGYDEILQLIEKRAIKEVLLADMAGSSVENGPYPHPLLLILSNEAHGVSSWAKNLFRKISIPISSSVESLNVAIAGGILMHQITV